MAVVTCSIRPSSRPRRDWKACASDDVRMTDGESATARSGHAAAYDSGSGRYGLGAISRTNSPETQRVMPVERASPVACLGRAARLKPSAATEEGPDTRSSARLACSPLSLTAQNARCAACPLQPAASGNVRPSRSHRVGVAPAHVGRRHALHFPPHACAGAPMGEPVRLPTANGREAGPRRAKPAQLALLTLSSSSDSAARLLRRRCIRDPLCSAPTRETRETCTRALRHARRDPDAQRETTARERWRRAPR
jgi:hypothetical protein